MELFKVMTATAQMPSSCWGRYGKVAVVELETPDSEPKMISERARGIKRIVALWDRCFWGKTERCEFNKALREAEKMAAELNAA